MSLCADPLTVDLLFPSAHASSRHKPRWFLKRKYFGDSGLWCRSQGLGCHIWGMDSLVPQVMLPCLWDPSWVWVSVQEVGVLVRLYLCLSNLSGVVLLSTWRNCSTSFQALFIGNWSMCSCRFGVSVGGAEFRIFLLCHLEPNPSRTVTSNYQWNNLMLLPKYFSKTDLPETPATPHTWVRSQGFLYLYSLTHILLLLHSCSFLFY